MAPVTRRKMSSPERNRVMSLHNDGKSLLDIIDIIGRARTNVQRIIAKYKQCGHIERGKKTGRPPKTTPKEDRQIVRRSLSDRFEAIAKIAPELKVRSDKSVSRFTVSRKIKRAGLHTRVPVSKPLISKKKIRNVGFNLLSNMSCGPMISGLEFIQATNPKSKLSDLTGLLMSGPK